MKYLLFALILLITSCNNNDYEKFSINDNNIANIAIRKRVDTVALQLSAGQSENLLTSLKNAEPVGVFKHFAEYHITMHYKHGTVEEFTTSRAFIRAEGGRCYKLSDSTYFQKLWFDLNGLTPDHHEYFPTYREDGGIYQVNEILNDKNLASIKEVLSQHGHPWVDVRGVIFYQGNLTDEQLANYTAKARGIE